MHRNTIPLFGILFGIAISVGCSDPRTGNVTVLTEIPCSKRIVLQRGEWFGVRLPNQKTIYLSCIRDDKPQLVPYSGTGDRTYFGDHPWAQDQTNDYIVVGESKIVQDLSPIRREYTLFVADYRLDVVEDHSIEVVCL